MNSLYDTQTFRLQDGLGYRIGRVRKAIIEKIDQQLAPLDIAGAQWWVLLLVADEGIVCPGDLCKRMTYDSGAMTRLLDRLEGKGLLRRLPADGDRRSLRLELTPAGSALYPQIRAALVDVFNALLAGFTPDEANALNGYLDRILRNADAAN